MIICTVIIVNSAWYLDTHGLYVLIQRPIVISFHEAPDFLAAPLGILLTEVKAKMKISVFVPYINPSMQC